MKIQQKFLSSTKGKLGGEHKKWATLRESWEFGYLHYTEDRLRYALQSLHLHGHHAQCERVKQTMEMFSCFYYLQHFGKHGITYELSGLENFR